MINNSLAKRKFSNIQVKSMLMWMFENFRLAKELLIIGMH